MLVPCLELVSSNSYHPHYSRPPESSFPFITRDRRGINPNAFNWSLATVKALLLVEADNSTNKPGSLRDDDSTILRLTNATGLGLQRTERDKFDSGPVDHESMLNEKKKC